MVLEKRVQDFQSSTIFPDGEFPIDPMKLDVLHQVGGNFFIRL